MSLYIYLIKTSGYFFAYVICNTTSRWLKTHCSHADRLFSPH